MDPFQTKFHDCWKIKDPKIHISEFPYFREIGPYSSGRHFSQSCAPQKNGAERYRQYSEAKIWKTSFISISGPLSSGSLVLGPELEILVPGSWYKDPGTRILVPASRSQNLGTYQDPGIRVVVPRAWYQDPGTKILVLAKRCYFVLIVVNSC